MSHLRVGTYTAIHQHGIRNNTRSRTEDMNHTTESHLCSSPPSPLWLSTILHRSEATSSFCWLVRLRLGMWSWHGLLSERLNSRYGTKACWSSSQYSRLQGTWKKKHESAAEAWDTFLCYWIISICWCVLIGRHPVLIPFSSDLRLQFKQKLSWLPLPLSWEHSTLNFSVKLCNWGRGTTSCLWILWLHAATVICKASNTNILGTLIRVKGNLCLGQGLDM